MSAGSSNLPVPPIGRSPSFIRHAAAADAVDPDTLVGLACDENYWVRRQAVQNPATPAWVLELLVRAGATPDLRGKGQPDLTLEAARLHRLVECGPWAQQLVAEHPNTPDYVLEALKDQPSLPLRLAVAKHPNASASTLATLCADGESAVRTIAVSHPHCPPDVIQLLIAAGSELDLYSVHRPGSELTTGQLQQLFDLGPWGKFLAVRHLTCPAEMLDRVIKDADWRVRSGVLDNPHTPAEALAHLLATGDDTELALIRQISSTEPATEALADLAEHPAAEVRLAVARHPAVTPIVLKKLLGDVTKEVRSSVAGNPRTDAADITLLVLAGATPDLIGLSEPDPKMALVDLDRLSRQGPWARLLVVRHPNTTADTLARLICDGDPKIREWAAVHPNAPQDVIETLFRAGCGTDFQGFAPPDPTLSGESLRKLTELGPWAQNVVAANPHAPLDLLQELASSTDATVRKLAARNLDGSRSDIR